MDRDTGKAGGTGRGAGRRTEISFLSETPAKRLRRILCGHARLRVRSCAQARTAQKRHPCSGTGMEARLCYLALRSDLARRGRAHWRSAATPSPLAPLDLFFPLVLPHPCLFTFFYWLFSSTSILAFCLSRRAVSAPGRGTRERTGA